RLGLQSLRIAAHGPISPETPEPALREVEDTARLAVRLGLRVGVLGVLDRDHLCALAAIEVISEFHVGPALIAHALLVGMERAARGLVRFLSCGAHAGRVPS